MMHIKKEMKIVLSNEVLDQFTLINHQYLTSQDYYECKSGINEYRMYSYLSTLFNNTTILDIGTFQGRSAVALSHNVSNHVISYDVKDWIKQNGHPIYTKPNITFRVKNVLDDLTEDFVKNVKIIVIDIDHYELMERKIIDKLYEVKFSGIILLDDVFHHPDPQMNICMNRLWTSLHGNKLNITKYGHCSGTGVLITDDSIEFECV